MAISLECAIVRALGRPTRSTCSFLPRRHMSERMQETPESLRVTYEVRSRYLVTPRRLSANCQSCTSMFQQKSLIHCGLVADWGTMTYWLLVTSEKNWKICYRDRTWGVEPNNARAIQRVEPGDMMLVHLRGFRLAGIVKASSQPYFDRKRKWPDGDYPHRLSFDPVLIPPNPLDVREFYYDNFQKKPQFYFRRSIRDIPRKEFELFQDFLNKHAGVRLREKERRIFVSRKYGPSGEGADHKQLKQWIAQNPNEIGLTEVLTKETEYVYPSGDVADVMFNISGNRYAVVEIETLNPLPGAYQALKYKVLKCAEAGLDVRSVNVEAILVAWSIPTDVRRFCRKYAIRCIEKKVTQ